MKKLGKIIIWFLGACVVAIIIAEILTVSLTREYIYEDRENVPNNSVGLLLGTSKYIADGRRNLFYIHRIDATQDLYDAEKIQYILVSGDNSTAKYNETDTMKEDLVDVGIPEENIYGDYAGFRTLDSVVRAREVFGQESYTVISQEFHLERAIFLARSQGIDAVGFVAQDVPVKLAPRVWIRERLARVKMMIDIIFGVDPKFLGEGIEIGG